MSFPWVSPTFFLARSGQLFSRPCPFPGPFFRSRKESDVIGKMFLPAYGKNDFLSHGNGVKVGLIFPVLVGFNFPVSCHYSNPIAPTRSRSFMR